MRDDLTLAFKLKYPGLHYLSQIEVASPTALAKLGKPFKFESWDKDRLVLVANDRYWGGRPKVNRVVFEFIPGGDAVVEAMLKGGVDFSSVLPEPTLFERLREEPRIKLAQVPGLNVFYLGFYTERAPLNNPHLRRAVAQALGRGVALPAKGPLSPAMLGYDPSVSQAAYDPRAARELVARSGGTPDLTLRLVHNNTTPFDVDLASSIRVDLRQIGITVQLLGKPGFAEMVKAVRAREGDMFMYSWHVRSPHPERLLHPLFHSKSSGTSNLTQYTNPKLDRILDEALMAPEGPVQARLYSQIQKTIVDEAPMVFLYHSTRMAAYADRVKGLELNLGALPHDKLVTDLALAVERDLRRIGFNLSRREMPTWPDLVKAAAEGEGHLFLYSWHMRTDDAQGFLRALFHSSNIGVSNLTGYANPEVDRLLDLTPPSEFSAAQATILAEAPMVFLAHWTRVAAQAANVRHLRLNLGVLPEDKLVGVDLAR